MPQAQQFRISNFNAGYKPNAGTTTLRNVSARDWQNFRVNQDGQLTPRAGSTRVNTVALGATPETIIKAYYLIKNSADRNPMIVVDDEVKYSEDDGVTFSSFSPALAAASGERRYYHSQQDDLLMIGNGRGEQYAIDISVSPPVARNFYLEQPPQITAARNGAGNLGQGNYHYHMIYVREVSGVPVAFSTIGTVRTIDLSAFANSQVDLTGLNDPTDGQITHKYIYRTNVGDVSTGTFRYVTSIAVSDGTTFTDNVADASLPVVITLNKGLMLTVIEPDWLYTEIADNRNHVVEDDSDTIHLSFFDGSSEAYIRNFTDTITVGNKTEPITAIKALSERVIVIYFPRSIYLMFTDPLAESYRITQSPIIGSDTDQTAGCVAARSLVRMGGQHYFFAPDKRIYRFDGSTAQWISRDIQPELDAINDLRVDQPVGAYFEGFYLLAYPSGDGANDRVLLYDPTLDQWFRDFGVGINDFTTGRRTGAAGDDEGELWVAMSDESYIRQLYTGTQDNSVAITCVWESNKIRARSSFTSFQNIAAKTQGAATITATVTTERGNASATLTPTSASDYFGQKSGLNGLKGREMQAKVSTSSIVDIDEITVNERVNG